MPTRMANCVERIPDFCNAASYKLVTARAVFRKLKEAQYPVPFRSREELFFFLLSTLDMYIHLRI
jgi:hypothetical protein